MFLLCLCRCKSPDELISKGFFGIIICFILLFPQRDILAQTETVSSIEQLISSGELKQAKALIDQQDKRFKNSPKGLELMGDIYGGLKMWDSAMARFEKLKSLSPNSPSGYFKYGGALGISALTKNKFAAILDLDEIEAQFQKALELDPSYVEAHWALVEFYLQVPSIVGGGAKKAKNQANRLLEVSSIDGLMALAKIAEDQNQKDEAETLLKKANDQGASLWTHQALIVFYEREKKWDRAFEVLNSALGRFDEPSLCYQWAKISVLSQREIDRGISCIEQCVDQREKLVNIPFKWVLLRQAQLLRLNGQSELALTKLDLALDIDSDFDQAKDERLRLVKLLN